MTPDIETVSVLAPGWVSVQEVADQLGVFDSTVRYLAIQSAAYDPVYDAVKESFVGA